MQAAFPFAQDYFAAFGCVRHLPSKGGEVSPQGVFAYPQRG